MMGPPTILGLSHDYKNLSKWLEAELIPAFESTFRIPERSCFANYYDFDEKDSGVYLKRGFKSIWDPVPATVIEYGGMICLLWSGLDMRLTASRNVGTSWTSQNTMVSLHGKALLAQ